MIQTTGKTDFDVYSYLDGWAQMMITIFVEKAIELNIRESGEFMESFMYDVQTNAQGDVTKIVHTYLYYGRFVDMGVGRGTKLDDREGSERRKKEWYQKNYYRSVKKMTEELSLVFNQQIHEIIVDTISDSSSLLQFRF